MLYEIESVKHKQIIVADTRNCSEIRRVLDSILYVPVNRLKKKIIGELINYLEEKFAIKTYKIKIFIAYFNSEARGFVICQIDPYFKSYGKKCGTFGWLNANDFEVCRSLIKECENFLKENKIRRIRGNINFPKTIGGYGIQVHGFNQQMMYGVAFNDPNSRVIDYLQKFGYNRESEYTCMKVTKKTWDSGKNIAKDIRLGFLTLDEFINKKEEILDLGKNSFYTILPDSSGGEERFDEIVETFSQIPKSLFRLSDKVNLKKYSKFPEFIEAWMSCDLEKILPSVPIAFNRKTGELAGIILAVPDIYEIWLNKPITRINVDTAMVGRKYTGKGIFSALNNIGQLTCNLFGVKYYEGTTIWSNNKDAINTIFPHCQHIRKHYVVQKRIK